MSIYDDHLGANAANMSLISEHFYVQEGAGLMGHVAQVPREIRRIAEELGLRVCTPDEARRMLALKGPDRVAFA